MNNILDEARTSDPVEAAVNAFSPDTVELKDGLARGFRDISHAAAPSSLGGEEIFWKLRMRRKRS